MIRGIMHFKYFSKLIMCLIVPYSLTSQQADLCDELLPFTAHLFNTGNYPELIRLDTYCDFDDQPLQERDTLNYLLASSWLQLEKTQSAMNLYAGINDETLRYRGIRYGFNSMLRLGHHKNAVQWLSDNRIQTSVDPDLAFFAGGLFLLEQNYAGYDSLMMTNPPMAAENAVILEDFSSRYDEVNMRSPWMAGLLSAVVPGLGKVYAGKPNQGLSSFITFGLSALQSYEAYYRLGSDSPVFYITGLIALGYYIGNIWGSALSVKIRKSEELYEINQDLRGRLYFSL
ncbi:MAG: hypothetical protein ACOC4R_00315 [Bacteroidota bacterium]